MLLMIYFIQNKVMDIALVNNNKEIVLVYKSTYGTPIVLVCKSTYGTPIGK